MPHRFHGDRTQTRKGGRYDRSHQRARAAAAKRHDPQDPCARCGHPLGPMGRWLHYDHAEDGTYLGFSHAACNMRAGAVKGRELQGGQPTGPISQRTCPICHQDFQPNHHKQRLCGDECRQQLHAQHPPQAPRPIPARPCAVCSTTFQPATSNGVCCSDPCRKQRQREAQRQWKQKAGPEYGRRKNQESRERRRTRAW